MNRHSYKQFYNSVGASYPEEDEVYDTLKGRLRRKFVMERLAAWKGRFLDIGCNRGMYLRSYQGGFKMGIDLSLPVLYFLRMKDPNIVLAAADAQNLNCIRSSSFDIVLCSEVLEHVHKPRNVLMHIQRVMKPGAYALITTPNYKGQRPEWVDTGVLRQYGVEGVKGDLYFHTAFKPGELEKMGRRHGLEVVEKGTLEQEIRYAAKLPALMFNVIRCFNRCIFHSEKMALINQKWLDRNTTFFYFLARITGLNKWLKKCFPEGVRSYIILRKPDL